MLTALDAASAQPGWSGRVDASRVGLAGHSAGAASSLQAAAQLGARAGAVAALGAWVNVASCPWLAAFPALLSAPALLLGGQFDFDAPVGRNVRPLLPLLRSPALLPVLAGGTHCFINWSATGQEGSVYREENALGIGFAGQSTCELNAAFALPPPAGVCGLSQPDQVAVTATLLTAWFAAHLRGDAAAGRLLWSARPGPLFSSVAAQPGAALAVAGPAPGPGRSCALTLTSASPAATEWALSSAPVLGPTSSAVALSVHSVSLSPDPAAAAAAEQAGAQPRPPKWTAADLPALVWQARLCLCVSQPTCHLTSGASPSSRLQNLFGWASTLFPAKAQATAPLPPPPSVSFTATFWAGATPGDAADVFATRAGRDGAVTAALRLTAACEEGT